jgi:hypothetical protein
MVKIWDDDVCVLRDLRGWKKQKAAENCIMTFMTVLLAKYY